MDYKCSSCGAIHKEQRDVCLFCGGSINQDISPPPPTGVPTVLDIDQTPSPSAPPVSEAHASGTLGETEPDTATASNPLLETWKTSVGFSFLGIIVGAAADWVVLAVGSLVGTLIALLLSLIFEELSAVARANTMLIVALLLLVIIWGIYATKIYPAFFSDKPLFKSSKLASFFNCFFGGPIFGPLWNSSLTNKTMGVSHKVFIVLLVIVAIAVPFRFASLHASSNYLDDARAPVNAYQPYSTQPSTGINSNASSYFIGTWKLSTAVVNGSTYTTKELASMSLSGSITLRSDGTFALNLFNKNSEGTWRTKDASTILLTLGGETIESGLSAGRIMLIADQGTAYYFSKI